MPPERNTLRPVWWFVFPLVLFDVLEGPCSPLYSLGEQGYMKILVEFCYDSSPRDSASFRDRRLVLLLFG